MSGKVIYEVEITGTESAAEKLAAVEKAISKASATTAAAVNADIKAAALKTTGHLEGEFKSISRDIDVIGGALSANVLKATADVLGLATAVGTGGVGAALAGIAVVVGGVIKAWGDWESAGRRAEEANAAALKTATDWATQMGRALEEDSKAVDANSIRRQEAHLKARGLMDAQLIMEEGVLRAQAAARRYTLDGILEAEEQKRQAAEISSRRMDFLRVTEELRERLSDDKKALRLADATGREGKAQEAWTKKHNAEVEARSKKEESAAEAKAKKAKADAEAVGRYQREQMEAGNKRDAEDAAEQGKAERDNAASLRKDAIRLAKDLEADEKKDDEKATAAAKKHADAIAKRTEEEKKLAVAIQERQEKQNNADMATLSSAVANESYAASVMVVSAAMGPLNAHLTRFGTINRENWRDLLLFTEDSKAAFAAQVQAALWSLTQQAGSKATMEAGEAVKETALAFGAYAIHDYGGAGLHAASAATHTVAAQVYAGIAGTSAGASVGIGMARGEGGLVGLTKEEREAKDREIGTRTAGDSAGGPIAGVGRSERAGPVVVNFVYEAGAINAQNRDAAAATVASATRHARRDGFRRREMGG